MIPPACGLAEGEHWNRHSPLCFQSLIITRNLIPRNRGAACPLVPRFGSAVNDSTIVREFKGLNQIGSVCASSAKRDFASKLSRLLTAFSKDDPDCLHRRRRSSRGRPAIVAESLAPRRASHGN